MRRSSWGDLGLIAGISMVPFMLVIYGTKFGAGVSPDSASNAAAA